MSGNEIDEIFQKLKNNEPFKQIFFEKLATTNNPYPWFEKLSKERYLDPESNNKNPIVADNTYTAQQWPALAYLENVATTLSKKPDDLILNRLVEVIDKIINFKESGKRIENPYTDYEIIKIIFMLPIDRITEKHVDFLQVVLESKFRYMPISFIIKQKVIPHLIEYKAKELLLQTLKVVLDYKKDEETFSRLEFTSVIEDYWLSIIIQENGDQIIEICGISLAKLIADVMKTVLEKNADAFSYLIIRTVEENTQNFVKDKYQLQLVYFLRKTLEHIVPPVQEVVLRDFLKSNDCIFKRVGIHLINYFYDEYNALFWQIRDNPLETELFHESYELAVKNKTKITDGQIDIYLSWVEDIKLFATEDIHEDPKRHNEIVANEKRNRLAALEGLKNEKVRILDEKYAKIWPHRSEHIGYSVWTETYGGILGIPDVFPPEVIAKSNAKLVQYILEYTPKCPIYKKHDLLYSFREIVQNNPEKFVSDISPFLNLEFDIQDALIAGFTDALKNGHQFSVKPVLEFLSSILNQSSNDDKKWQQTFFTRSIAESVAEFIYTGTSDEKHYFDDEVLPLCESMLLQVIINAVAIVTNNRTDDITTSHDPAHVITEVLNSPLGKVYDAMIAYSLRFAKVNNKDKEEKWVDSIKDYYQKAIEGLNRTVEFEISLGKFLSHLYYLDESWTTKNINKLFPKEEETIWRYGFMSYLFYSRFSSKLYCLLKENGHYTKALDSVEDFFKELPRHICIAYLNDLEKLEKGSLLDGLITGSNASYLTGFVEFFGHQHDNLDEKMKNKIKPVWSAIINHIKSAPEKIDEYKKVLAYLYCWLDIVDDIDDDVVEWISYSNKFIKEFDYMFIKRLNNHVEKNPKQVADIFYNLLSEVGYIPFIQTAEIIYLVEQLFKNGQEKTAIKICNKYYNPGGHTFLMPIFERYKQKSLNKAEP